jgi:hypothetical protein
MALTQPEVDIANQSLGKIGSGQMTIAATTNQGIQATLHFEQTRDSLLRSFEWPFARTRIRLVSEWLTDTTYSTDQYVWEAGLLYKCIVAHTSDVFATDLTNLDWSLQSTVDAWATLTVYAVGELVTINALLYECIVAHTAGVFATDLAAGDWKLTDTKPVNVFGYSYSLPADSLRLREFVDDDADDIGWDLESNTILTDETEVDIVYVKQVTDTTAWDTLFFEMMINQLAINLLMPLTGAGSSQVEYRKLLVGEQQLLKRGARTVGKQEARGNKPKVSWKQARVINTRIQT